VHTRKYDFGFTGLLALTCDFIISLAVLIIFLSQALSDGYLVPLRLAPAFFALVRGDADLSDLAVQLASSTSHMTGEHMVLGLF